jgi:hypothetical protein
LNKTHQLTPKDQEQLWSAVNKALIAADADYGDWPPEEQEHFRARMGEDAIRKINHVLLDRLLDIPCQVDEVDETLDRVSEIDSGVPEFKVLLFNWAKLLTRGIGEDYIYLNELMPEDQSLLDFPTLYAYDYADYLLQQTAFKQEHSNDKGNEYYPYLPNYWARLLINKQFYYTTLTSLASYVLSESQTIGDELIKQLIPHQYIEGKNHGKPAAGDLVIYDMEIGALGLEDQLNELNHRWNDYQQERWLAISRASAQKNPAVYIYDESQNNDPKKIFIFTNEKALKQIRWCHFLSDCTPLLADNADIEKIQAEEIVMAKAWILNNYQDIQNNFDATSPTLNKSKTAADIP